MAKRYDEHIALQKAVIAQQEQKIVKPLTDTGSPLASIPDAMRDAAGKLATAAKSLATARADALGATLEELRNGTRGTSSQQVTARKIAEDEARARRLRDSGNTTTRMIDGKNQEVGAEFFQNRALEARSGLDNLKSGERDPYGTVETAIKNSESHLKDIKDSLTPVEVTNAK